MRCFIVKQFRKLTLLCLVCSVVLLSLHVLNDTSHKSKSLARPLTFPKKIWQSWKVDPTFFEFRDTERVRTWTLKNPMHRYEVLTDANADGYVEEHFGPTGFNRPDIVHTYKSLDAKIIKSDLLRYLIMYVEGGVYVDIDVEAIKPVSHFIPKRFDESEVDMVIGIEVDEPTFAAHPVLGSKSQSFCQWTFMCKPRLPVMMRLIENIMIWLDNLSEKQGKPISELYLDFNEVISGTGPSAFTTAILAEMSKTTGRTVTWDTFHGLTEGKLIGGVLVLSVEAFAAGTGHSESGNHGGKGAMVKHHFHASSWPTKHPRFKHPIFGEVEKCNWNMECVKLWDANTAFFDGLSEEERLKIIALKSRPKISAPIEEILHRREEPVVVVDPLPDGNVAEVQLVPDSFPEPVPEPDSFPEAAQLIGDLAGALSPPSQVNLAEEISTEPPAAEIHEEVSRLLW